MSLSIFVRNETSKFFEFLKKHGKQINKPDDPFKYSYRIEFERKGIPCHYQVIFTKYYNFMKDAKYDYLMDLHPYNNRYTVRIYPRNCDSLIEPYDNRFIGTYLDESFIKTKYNLNNLFTCLLDFQDEREKILKQLYISPTDYKIAKKSTLITELHKRDKKLEDLTQSDDDKHKFYMQCDIQYLAKLAIWYDKSLSLVFLDISDYIMRGKENLIDIIMKYEKDSIKEIRETSYKMYNNVKNRNDYLTQLYKQERVLKLSENAKIIT